jgi:formylglycine-generating enzyme required for sulfatase activity
VVFLGKNQSLFHSSRDMKTKFIFLGLLALCGLLQPGSAAPELLTYSGRLSQSDQAYTGQAHFKFALVNRNGTFSYWTNDGNFTTPQEPTQSVAVTVSNGVYSVPLGNAALAGMQALPGSIFRDHNDAHLRIWVRLGPSGNFHQLSPDQTVSSAPYALGGNGAVSANPSSGGSVSNGSVSSGNTVSQPQSSAAANVGAYARLVANGPAQPSATLVLLTGDSADIVTYYADEPGRLEYAFGAHTFAFPKAGESLVDQKTLVGPASIRLVAPTGAKNVTILLVKRADGRDPTRLEGAPAPPAEGQTPVNSPPAIVSVPSTRSVARGGTTTLFVSASGENLTYQWKKNGQIISGATSSALPLENATGTDAGQYVVDVTNPNGSISSQAITVTVKMPVVPAGVYRINNSGHLLGHEVSLTSFSIDQHEVTKAFWDEVYTWAIANGYDFSNAGIAEGPEYPVHSINWYDSVKWANALSERDGHTPCYYTDNNCTVIYRAGQVDLTNYNVKWNANGYRLPTETEWEVAARGGLVGSKYAWGESPSTTRANFDQTLHGATIPVGSFPDNGYGLYEIGGNLREWTWDSNDTTTDANSSQNLVDDVNSTAFFVPEVKGYQPFFGDAQSAASSRTNSGSYTTRKTLNFGRSIFVLEVKNELRVTNNYYSHTALCRIKFNYSDATFDYSNENSVYKDSNFISKNYINPNYAKEVESIEVQLYVTGNRSGYDSEERNTRVYRYPSNTNVGYLTLNIPTYVLDEASATHFEVNIDATREAGDDIWFELVDGENNQTYANADFGTKLALPGNIQRPKKLRIYINQSPASSTIGGTFVHAVYWNSLQSSTPSRTIDQTVLFSVDSDSRRNGPIDNPRGWWKSTQRLVRDNHYAEALKNLGKRGFSAPDRRYSTVGFRLVQRP